MVSREQIEQLVGDIVRGFAPQRVVLFGSYAYGVPSPDSDVDLFVQMPCRTHPARVAVEIRLKVRPKFPVDLVVRDPADVRQRMADGDSFLREVTTRGQVLYESRDQ